MLPYLFVLFSMIAFGLSNVCWKPLLSFRSSTELLFQRSIYTVLLFLTLGIVTRVINMYILPETFDIPSILVNPNTPTAITSILLSLIGLYLFVSSTKLIPTSMAGILICSSSLMSAWLGWWFNQEAITVHLAVGFLMTAIGVMLLENINQWKKPSMKGIRLALGAAALWAIANLGFKTTIPSLGTLNFSLLQECIVLSVTTSIIFIQKKMPDTLQKPIYRFKPEGLILLISGCTVVGVFFNNLGLKQLPISQYALMVLAQPLTTLLAASMWLKERLSKKQWIGTCLILAGIYWGTS